jgi:signal transduction histidine kinase/Flp pilus assembly protein TadD/ActR/RegA family two-component response regulator
VKKIGFAFVLLFIELLASAANDVDSLRNLLIPASGYKKLELLIGIGTEYQANTFDSALFYFAQAKKLANDLNRSDKINELNKLIGTVYFRKGDYRRAQVEYDIALEGYKKTNDLVGQAKIYNNLSMLFQAQGKNKEAIENLEKALKTFIDNGNEQLQTLPLTNLGIIYFRSGNFQQALNNFNQALIIAKKYNDWANISNITNNLGTVYKELGNYPEALDCFNQSVESYQIQGDKFGESASCNNIGILFKEIGNYKQAILYINKSLQIKREIQALDKIPASLIILGDIYCDWQKYELALDYYYEALELSKTSENLSDQAVALYGIGNVFLKTDLYIKALDLLGEAAKIFESVDSKREWAQTINDMGVVYSTILKDIHKADQLFEKAETLYQEMGLTVGLAQLEHNKGLHFYQQRFWEKAIVCFEKSNRLMPYNHYHLHDNYKLLGESYIKTGNLKASVAAYQKALQYKDSIMKDKTDLQLAQVEIEYQVQKKELEIEKLNEQNKFITLQTNKKKNMQYLFLTFSLILSALVIFILFFTLKLKKINGQLKIQQLKIELQKKDLQETNSKLIKAKEEADKNNDFKSQFLANISHEIRTPLNAIIGYTKLMDKNNQTNFNSNYLNNIIQASGNLSVIINDLLDFSKIEAGKMILEHAEFHPFEIITHAISTLNYRAEEKNITCEIHIDPLIPGTLKGDPYRLSQIMINLISNALKFSNNHQVVTIEANCKIETNRCQLIFSVKDYGIGIEEEQQENIFESFNQAQKDTARIFGGTGLGLAIVKRLVSLQGGTVELQSKINKGSTFTVKIWYEIPPAPVAQEYIKSDKNTKEITLGEKQYNILLVEDNLINQELAKDTINSWNLPFTVDIADNGREAIAALKNKMYHAILMDIQMPVMDGHEATKFIRNEMPEPISSIPIIGITAHALTTEKELAFKNGMNEYITKPFNPDELKQKIVSFVRLQ